LEEIITSIRGPDPRGTSPDDSNAILTGLRRYTIAANGFSPAAKDVEKILDLSVLNEPGYWIGLLDYESDPTPLFGLRVNLNFARRHLPKVLRLLERDVDVVTEIEDSESSEEAILSILVIEAQGQHSRPTRLIEVLASVESFYEACAIMLDMPPQQLSVLSCDSGSDKSFDFLGAAKVIECVKELILSLWDRVVYFREHQAAERVKLISEALPIIQRVGELEAEGRIAPEQAGILRAKIIGGVGRFLHSGAIIPEIQQRVYNEPRALMAPERRLITARSSAIDEASAEESNDSPVVKRRSTRSTTKKSTSKQRGRAKSARKPRSTGLSARENAELERLLKKQQGNRAPPAQSVEDED
jgi:hypothetical protein